uniref:Transcription factor zinc-finger domain-containing protein n=1 Tax=Chlorobium chlorochromatii (strain CaD3) TaxID=340177 RepID=Q3ARG9_CHLCH
MKCPACHTELLLAERQGIEIDYCPSCRGVWLDRGELDKIIERSASYSSEKRYEKEAYHQHDKESHYRYHNDDRDDYIDPKSGKRKRKGGPLGFLEDLFD